MADGRFAGQESTLSVLDVTTGDVLIGDIALESSVVTFPFDLVKKQYMGEIGPTYRAFHDGWEAEIKVSPNDVGQIVSLANLLIAKASGASQDEIAISMKYISPIGAFQVVLRDAASEGLPLDMGGGHDFLMTSLKFKGKIYKIAKV